MIGSRFVRDIVPPTQVFHTTSAFTLVRLIGVVLLAGGCTVGARASVATPPSEAESPPSPERFAIRPQDLETNARTTAAGTFTLDSVPKARLYVPRQCVGTRCPLLIYLHGAGMDGASTITRLRPAADRYGLLILGPSATTPWWNGRNGADMPVNQRNLETALRETVHRVAVDRHRIALVGECNGGFPAHHWGFHNLDLFSRVGTISGELWDDSTIVVRTLIPRTTSAQFFVQESIVGGGDAVRAYRRVQELRDNGNTVKYVVSTRGHGGVAADFMLLGRWLSDSWAHRTTMVVPIIDPLPRMTTALATKATDMAAKLAHEGKQVWEDGQHDDMQELTVPVGERPAVLAVDLLSLVKKYPAVATDLQSSGLTAQDYNAARLALIAALLGETLHDVWQDPQGDMGVLGQNMAFVKAQPNMIETMHRLKFFEWP